MNPYVANPEWHGLIIGYFYLGGIASGAYATATLTSLFGAAEDRHATHAAHYLAFPLCAICGLLLIVDLGRPERFSHMILQSNTWRPMFKPWSPMSAGSWGLSVFGACCFASFVGALAEDRRMGFGRWSALFARLGRGWLSLPFRAVALLSAMYVAGYTGMLLSATNQPVWADTTWLSPLFLASAMSTGIASILLVGSQGAGRDSEAIARLERFDRMAMALEVAMIGAMAWSLGEQAGPVFGRWPGVLVVSVVLPFGLILPFALSRLSGHRFASIASLLVLIGGLVLRVAIVAMPVSHLLPVKSAH